MYDDYEVTGESLLDNNDKQKAAEGRVDGELAAARRILGDETRQNVGSRGPDSAKKLEETAKMSGAVAGVEKAFGDYLREPTPEHSKAISSSAKNFRVALGRFNKLRLDGEERERAAELRKRFDGAIAGIQDAIKTGRAVRMDEREFASLGADLNEALDREAREQRGEQAARAEGSTSQALARARTLVLGVLAASVAVLATALLLVTGIAARIWRGVVHAARRVKSAAGRVFHGDVRVERGLVPLGIVLAVLLWVAQSLVEAYPFGGGDLPGTLFPSRPAEWLGRGAAPATIVAFLAYVQFALNRRRRGEDAKLRGKRDERENEARSWRSWSPRTMRSSAGRSTGSSRVGTRGRAGSTATRTRRSWGDTGSSSPRPIS